MYNLGFCVILIRTWFFNLKIFQNPIFIANYDFNQYPIKYK